MKLPSLTRKLVTVFEGLTRTGTARGPGAVGKDPEPMGPPLHHIYSGPACQVGEHSPSALDVSTDVAGYYALGHEDAKRIRQQPVSGEVCRRTRFEGCTYFWPDDNVSSK